jgi:D-lactate dehydrogenase
MRTAFFSARRDERPFFQGSPHAITFLEAPLSHTTAKLASGYPAVCLFVNDNANAEALAELAAGGTKFIALRSAGFNHVDLAAAARHGLLIGRVPAYSPYAVAEHAVALILALNRKLVRANARVHENNFLLDGLMGFDLFGRTVGVIGTGQIGSVFAGIMRGFGCHVLACDPNPNLELGLEYVSRDELLQRSDIVSLHCPLTPATHHLIDDSAIQHMKPGAMLINTSRGALVDSTAAIRGLKSGQIGYLGLDVYEEEAGMFFEDLSTAIPMDDVFARLLTFSNVLITGHQAFYTRQALENIAATTIQNLTEFETTGTCTHLVKL